VVSVKKVLERAARGAACKSDHAIYHC